VGWRRATAGWAAGPEEHLAGKPKEFGVHCWTSEIMGHTSKMGCAACKASWAERGGEMGRAFGLGPERMDKIYIFFEFIFNAKQFPENLELF
jgi:hypothetical protein